MIPPKDGNTLCQSCLEMRERKSWAQAGLRDTGQLLIHPPPPYDQTHLQQAALISFHDRSHLHTHTPLALHTVMS